MHCLELPCQEGIRKDGNCDKVPSCGVKHGGGALKLFTKHHANRHVGNARSVAVPQRIEDCTSSPSFSKQRWFVFTPCATPCAGALRGMLPRQMPVALRLRHMSKRLRCGAAAARAAGAARARRRLHQDAIRLNNIAVLARRENATRARLICPGLSSRSERRTSTRAWREEQVYKINNTCNFDIYIDIYAQTPEVYPQGKTIRRMYSSYIIHEI